MFRFKELSLLFSSKILNTKNVNWDLSTITNTNKKWWLKTSAPSQTTYNSFLLGFRWVCPVIRPWPEFSMHYQKHHRQIVMGRASESRAWTSMSFERSSPGGPEPRPFQKKLSTSRARASLTSLIWVNFKIISYQNYAIQKWIVLFSKISQEFQVLNGIRNHKIVSKYFFKKISNTFGLNIANLSSFYDRLLCPGPLPGTILFWPRARASPSLGP